MLVHVVHVVGDGHKAYPQRSFRFPACWNLYLTIDLCHVLQ